MPNSDNKVILQSRKKIFFFSFQYYLFLSEMTLNEKEIFIFIDTCAQYQIVKDIQKLLFYFPVGFYFFIFKKIFLGGGQLGLYFF